MTLPLLGALMIGVSLGLLGSGGSILTVPVLTYLVGQDEKVAIAGSLGIVGGISAAAAIPYARKRLIDGRSVLYFGVPGMAGAYLGAWLSGFVGGTTQLVTFALLMLAASVSMARPLRDDVAGGLRSAWKIGVDGLVVGAVTGFVGVGGGFLIVPALVLLGGVPMHRAVGTSLVIIALKSFTGFAKSLDVLDDLGLSLDWTILGTFCAVGIAGSLGGNAVASRMPQQILRRAFAGFLLVVGVFVLVKSSLSA